MLRERAKFLQRERWGKALKFTADIAEIYLIKQDYELAFQEYQKRQDLAEKIGDRLEMALSYRYVCLLSWSLSSLIRNRTF